MKTKLWYLIALLGFSLGMMSPVTLAKNVKTPAYEDLWWAKNPTLMQFVQQQRQALKTIAVVAATNYVSMRQEAQNYTGSWRIENPTMNESSTAIAPSNIPTTQDRQQRQRTGSSGFRIYGENPTL